MTPHRLVTTMVAIVALLASAAACGSAGGADDDGIGSLGDAVDVAAAAPGSANAQACDLERQTLQTAAEAYTALFGAPPETEADLVDDGLLREPSELFDVTAEGDVVPAPTGPCS